MSDLRSMMDNFDESERKAKAYKRALISIFIHLEKGRIVEAMEEARKTLEINYELNDRFEYDRLKIRKNSPEFIIIPGGK